MELLPHSGRAQCFSKGENALLVHEVKKRQVRIYGSSATGPATRDGARQAWLEVAAAVSAFSGVQRHAEQVKKRYDTTRRSGIYGMKKAAANWRTPPEYGIMGPAEAEGVKHVSTYTTTAEEQWWKPLQEGTDQEATAGEGGAEAEEADPGPSAARQRPRQLRNNMVRPEEEEDHHPMLEIRRGLCSLKKARCGSGVAAPIKLNGAPGAFALKSRRPQRAKSTARNPWKPPFRSQRFSESEEKLLVHEVKARQARIYGSPTHRPTRDDARRAWAEVAEAVSAFSGIQRYVYQIKKRFDTTNRMMKRRAATNRRDRLASGGGQATTQRFSEGEEKLLVHEVKARQARIYGSPTHRPTRDGARRAWAEVAEAVAAFSGIQRSVNQIKKKLDTTNRMRKRRAAANRRDRLASGGGQATPEVLAASTLFPESIYGIGGPAENGGAEGDEPPLHVKSEETDRGGTGVEERAEEEEETDPDPDPGEGEGPSGVAAAEPGPSAARQRPPPRPSRNNMVTGPVPEEEEEDHHPIQEIQQAGFRMVQRELGALRRGLCSLNSRLVRQERLMAQGVTALQRSAAALERLAGLQGLPAAPPMMMMATSTRETAAPPAPPATASAGPE